MKFLRSTFVIAVAAFAAACGDKVTVQGPDPIQTAPRVNSVTVSPASVVMNVGQSVTFTAVVDVSNGAATTVTWSSSGAGVTVTAAGVATAASATPGVAICATSTADAGKRGCAQAVVTAASASVPPSVSIAAVNLTAAGGVQFPAPVPPAAVAGQLNVVMNVNAGTAILDSLVLKVGGKNAYKQTFTAAQAAALVAESVEQANLDPANQFGTQITGSFNSADYNTTTGAATWQNGNNAIQAFIYGKNSVTAGSSPTNVQGNSPSTTYRFGNPDGFHVSISLTQLTGGARTAGETQLASAVDAAGLGWKAGSMTVNALFVQYTPGITPTIVRATFNTIGCSPGSTGVKTLTLTNTGTGTPVAGPYTGTFNANPSTTGATTVDDYEFTPGAGGCPAAATASGGEIISMVAVGSDNNNIVMAFPAGRAGIGDGIGVLNALATSLNPDPSLVLRLDNVGPGGVTWDLQSTNSANTACAAGTAATSMGGRTNCWLNDAVVLNGRQTCTAAGGVCTDGFIGLASSGTSTNGVIRAAADGGSGRTIGTADGLTFTARVGLASDATSTVDASAPVTSVAGLAETAVANAYRLRTRAQDLLGNVTNSGSTTAGSGVASFFGVDRTAPVLTIVGGPGANARGVAAGGAYSFGATDNATAPAAPSGFFNLAATPLTVSQTRRSIVGGSESTRFFCPTTPGYVAGSSTTNNCAGTWPSATTRTYLANLIVSDNNADATDAYYTISATVDDQGGNRSAAASRVELIDGTASSIGGLSYPPFLTAGGAATFSSQIVDNLDIQSTRMNLQIGAAGAAQPAGACAAAALSCSLFDANTGAAFAPTTAAGGSTFWYPDQAVNGYNVSPLIPSTAFSNTVAQVYTHVQTTATTTGTPAAFGANNFLNTANGFVVNQANTATASATPIIAGALPAQTAMAGTGAAGAGPFNWFICGTTGSSPAVGTACPAVPAALPFATVAVSRDGGTAGTNTVISIDAVATGATGTFNNPFSSVQFWVYNPGTVTAANEGWRLVGNVVNAATVTDGGGAIPAGRNWHFIFNWDPTSTDAQDTGATYRIMAIGVGGPNLTTASQRGTAIATPLGAVNFTVVP